MTRATAKKFQIYNVNDLMKMSQQELEATDRDNLVQDIAIVCGYGANQTDRTRDLVITPFAGEYGPAGYLLAVNGSPARGKVLLEGRDGVTDDVRAMVVIGARSIRRYETFSRERWPVRVAQVFDGALYFIRAQKTMHGKSYEVKQFTRKRA